MMGSGRLARMLCKGHEVSHSGCAVVCSVRWRRSVLKIVYFVSVSHAIAGMYTADRAHITTFSRHFQIDNSIIHMPYRCHTHICVACTQNQHIYYQNLRGRPPPRQRLAMAQATAPPIHTMSTPRAQPSPLELILGKVLVNKPHVVRLELSHIHRLITLAIQIKTLKLLEPGQQFPVVIIQEVIIGVVLV